MGRRTFLASAALTPLALSLGGCGDDRWTDYSYKMTVWVGDKPFSTVRHVKVEEGTTIQSSTGRRVDYSVEGEAVIIETSSGPVFALMTPAEGDFGDGFYATRVAEPALTPAIHKAQESEADLATREYHEQQPGFDQLTDDAAAHNAMLKVEGLHDLPREIPYPDRNQGLRMISLWPMFVRFRDINDPSSVQKIPPESLGVSRITIEITDADVTTGIETRLNWLRELHGKALVGGNFNMRSPYGLDGGDFTTELFQ